MPTPTHTPARRKNLEEQLQQDIVTWSRVRAATCADLSLLHHTANGGFRLKGEAARLKAGGVLAGVSDLHLPGYFSKRLPGLWIELKVGDNDLTADQTQWINAMWLRGERVAVCRTTFAAIMVFAWHLNDGTLLGDVKSNTEWLKRSVQTEGVLLPRVLWNAPLSAKNVIALELPAPDAESFTHWVTSQRPKLLV